MFIFNWNLFDCQKDRYLKVLYRNPNIIVSNSLSHCFLTALLKEVRDFSVCPSIFLLRNIHHSNSSSVVRIFHSCTYFGEIVSKKIIRHFDMFNNEGIFLKIIVQSDSFGICFMFFFCFLEDSTISLLSVLMNFDSPFNS